MGKPCRLTFFAYKHGVSDPKAYDAGDLMNGVCYAEWLLEQGFTFEPLDDFDLRGFIKWAKVEMDKVSVCHS